jgi:DNA-binding CsgD family transcriptional regulator
MLDPTAASKLMARMRDAATKRDPLDGLTGQERRILELIGEGLTNRQIGERMYLAEKTVKNYTSVLFPKLGMERRTKAAAYAAHICDHNENEHVHVYYQGQHDRKTTGRKTHLAALLTSLPAGPRR